MSDKWFDEGQRIVFERIAKDMNLSVNTVTEVYNRFAEFNLSGDYDVEKEVFWDVVHGAYD